MTRDYRKGAPRPRKRDESRGTCAFWFLVGGLVGAFAVGLAWMRDDAGTPPEVAALAAPAAQKPAEEPAFDFARMLREEEVTIPQDPPAQPPPLPEPRPEGTAPTQTAKAAPAPAQKPAPPPATPRAAGPDTYILQVGAFSQGADAERLRAQLALLGIQTIVQTATTENGQTIHRVRTGAYTKSDASIVADRLKSDGHNTVMMRAK